MKEMLYLMTSKIDGFERDDGMFFDNVSIRWYVTERSTKAYAEYRKVLERYLSALDPTGTVPSINTLSAYFTAEECDLFEKLLRETKGWSVNHVEKRTLNPESEADVRRLAPESKRWSNVLVATERHNIGFKVSGLVSWHAATRSSAQDLELELTIDREIMKDLLPALKNRFSNVTDVIQQSVHAAIQQRVGEIAIPVSVDCEELIFENDLE